jgi:hypothetical protein
MRISFPHIVPVFIKEENRLLPRPIGGDSKLIILFIALPVRSYSKATNHLFRC